MSLSANFTLHAILAACLAALAASSAAAIEDAIGASRFSLTIDGVDVAGKRQDFDITGYRFGPTRAAGGWAKTDGLDVSWDTPDQNAAYSPANTK